MKNSESGSFNRAGRKSGGFAAPRLPSGTPSRELPALSIQCFEGRHHECRQTQGGVEWCECNCHDRPDLVSILRQLVDKWDAQMDRGVAMKRKDFDDARQAIKEAK